MLRAIGKFFWRFMVIFSFIVNLVLVVVVIVLALLLFDIKNNIAEPLVYGLHSTSVGLDQATIDWTIPVRDSLSVSLNVPINENTISSQVTEIGGQAVEPIAGETIVVLTRSVPLSVSANIDLPGVGNLNNAQVNLSLPAGLQLPVKLDMEVGLETDIPVSLDVRAVIPLSETQLHDPIETLGLLFEPLALALHNLPDDYAGAGDLAGQILRGEQVDLFATEGYNAWPGYSRTAGTNYDLFGAPVPLANQPQETGIVPIGGIPLLDQQLDRRAPLYENDSNPLEHNAQQRDTLQQRGLDPLFYDGSLTAYILIQKGAGSTGGQSQTVTGPGTGTSVGGPGNGQQPVTDDMGIITPTPPNN